MKAPEWIKLEQHSDWGVLYLSLPGRGMTSHGASDANACGLKLKQGGTIRVRFADESILEVSLLSKTRFTSGPVAGYTTMWREWGFLTKLHGTPVWIGLQDVEVDAVTLKGAVLP